MMVIYVCKFKVKIVLFYLKIKFKEVKPNTITTKNFFGYISIYHLSFWPRVSNFFIFSNKMSFLTYFTITTTKIYVAIKKKLKSKI